MKKLLAAAAAIVALAATSSAWAADLPPPQVFKAPPPPPWYDWTGFYIGGNGGYSWGRGATNYAVAGRAPFSTTQAINGGLGGGQIGYNWQFNHNWLLGIEADFQGTGERGGSGLPTIVIPPIIGAAVVPGSTTTANLSQSLPWFWHRTRPRWRGARRSMAALCDRRFGLCASLIRPSAAPRRPLAVS